MVSLLDKLEHKMMVIKFRQKIQLLLLVFITDTVYISAVMRQSSCVEPSALLCPSECCCREEYGGAGGGGSRGGGGGGSGGSRHARVSLQDTNVTEWSADCSWRNLTRIPDNFTNKTVKILLGGNLIEQIPAYSFSHLSQLQVLKLDNNYIRHLSRNAFNNPMLVRLYLGSNSISSLTEDAFTGLPNLEKLSLTNNPIQSVEWRTFRNMPKLRDLVLCCVTNLTVFPDLTKNHRLQKIILDRCSIAQIPHNFCGNMRSLQKLDLHSNAIVAIPKLSNCTRLISINVGNNKIRSLEGQLFHGLSSALDLILKSNRIAQIPGNAFVGLIKLMNLDLNGNGIDYIHPDAFKPLKRLEELHLANNKLHSLPSDGLFILQVLETSHNVHLEEIPGPEDLPNIAVVVTEYSYHCCEYEHMKPSIVSASIAAPAKQEMSHSSSYVTFASAAGNYSDSLIWTKESKGSSQSSYPSSLSFRFSSSVYSDYTYPADSFSYSGGLQWRGVQCFPQSGPFMPCSDLFGSWFLRVGVWLVFLLALVGNGIVILVIVFSHTEVDVSRFLICNLACADFAMGIYLGFLAGVDASTLGVFRKYGVHWQNSAGCGAASFLAVFSSELSIYTLSVITLERFYAIKHALHLEKRLQLKQAMVCMCIGWVFAIVIAIMPLSGVNNYYNYPVCLPLDISSNAAIVYARGILLMNGTAFVAIMVCYISIYCAIQGSHAWNCNDSRVARRMSLLVFTDFVCWAPIVFFGLTSSFNCKFISLYGTKILTVFFLPVNSCANPFLYTIFTKQFKKDCYRILRCFRLRNMTIRQNQTPATTASDTQVSSLRTSLSQIVFPSCCRTSSANHHDMHSPTLIKHSSSHRKYIYQSDMHTQCRRTCHCRTRFVKNAENDILDTAGRFVPKQHCKCSHIVPFWKKQSYSKSQEDVSLGMLHKEKHMPQKRRHSITDGILSDEKCSNKHEVTTSKFNNHRYVLINGHDSSRGNITSSLAKFTIISVEVTQEYERKEPLKRATSPVNRPTNLRMDCSSNPEMKSKTVSPKNKHNSKFAPSTCSSPTTISDCWSPTCSSGHSPNYLSGFAPQIMITEPSDTSLSTVSNGSPICIDLDKLEESRV